ncbi:excalibur calcium-binding domain-containing protein, partial [Mycolicibacterium fortuitum]
MRILIAATACAAATAGLVTAPVAGAYPNCAAARAAGAAPLYAGQPGYSSKLDRDGDGVA